MTTKTSVWMDFQTDHSSIYMTYNWIVFELCIMQCNAWLYVLLTWSVADFSSCQGNNSIKKLILSGFNCNIVFCSISLTKMFTNKAPGSYLTPIFFCRFKYILFDCWTKQKRNKILLLAWAAQRGYQLRDTKKLVFFYHLMFLYSNFYI